ncbi:MAG TPA: acyl-CoA dehydrogenase family protein [Polyangiaceae bacterium]|nr:acyl-CoA dehydrogenase family protein [Polyangiaceae bacterium]
MSNDSLDANSASERTGLFGRATSPLAAARRLVPLVLEHAAEAEAERRLPSVLAEAFNESGLFRLCVPRELGGLEADPGTVFDVVQELARADGSIAWVAMILGVGTRMLGALPQEGAREIYAQRDVTMCGSFVLGGRAVPVEGGYRISGRWPFMSGCDVAQWIAGACVVENEAQDIIVPLWPIQEGCIIDTWHVSGLRGTGSHDYEVPDVFVPHRRCIRMPLSEPTFPGQLYAFPPIAFLAATIACCALGIARGALDDLAHLAATKTPYGMTSKLASRPSAQLAFTEAEAALRSARAWLFESTFEIWEKAGAREAISVKDRALLRLAATNATASAARAVDRVYAAAGGTALYAKSPLQRRFRDIHAITQHAMVASHMNEILGKILLDVEPDSPFL